MTKRLDWAHLALVETVLRALPPDTPIARAMLACEDAYVALGVGLQLGLTVGRVAALHAETVAECQAEDDEPTRAAGAVDPQGDSNTRRLTTRDD